MVGVGVGVGGGVGAGVGLGAGELPLPPPAPDPPPLFPLKPGATPAHPTSSKQQRQIATKAACFNTPVPVLL